MTISLSRRAFVAGGAALPIACTPMAAHLPLPSADAGPVNPLVRQRADAQVFRHDDGFYYLTGSVPEYDRLVLRRSKTIAGLATAEERVLWRHQASGPMSGFIWAPELHLIDGRWIMYFAAGPSGGGEDVFRIRTFAVVCDGPDPMAGNWTVLGQFQAPWDSFCLDSTSFVHRGTRYFAWAQREPGIETNSNLYIAPLASPLTLARPATRLSIPTLDWEVRGFKVNEAPAVLARNGRLFMTYSASATDARYCLGMLTAPEDADIMDPRAWTKAQMPVFVTSRETGVFGPGHNSFTVDEQGRDILVYHGRDYERIDGDPLFDPNRHTRVQRLYFKADGSPDFGVPVGNGPLPVRLLGPDGSALCCEEGRLFVGAAHLASTQFRMIEDAAGIVTIQPILRRDELVTVLPDGGIGLARNGASPAQRFIAHRSAEGTVSLESAARRSFALSASRTLALVPAPSATLWRVD
ncbi:glycoside hydrolase family 43 protein [Novosphingobium olei]|uniref:glycoside hydrolase family 43 protein n=1 Tax=Novosphingobium olei TaxID=2728851 RepID=UPI00308FA759|nr:glycoside hydrolase family 43 protein [Novosphingobium olei]